MEKRETRNSIGSIGYTTGTCAAATAKAATLMLFSQQKVDQIEVDTPAGIPFSLPLSDCWIKKTKASCGVIKDAGSDPDVTHGVKIFAEVGISSRFTTCPEQSRRVHGSRWETQKSGREIVVRGGEGIGRVTKPGLSVPVGASAINPVPLGMIKESIMEVLPFFPSSTSYLLEVIISAPEGRKRAKRTFNPKLGIVGGISILGTTGIVRPMSDESWKESLLLQIDIAREAGYKEIVLTPGNMGEKVAKKLGFPSEAIVQISNFVGFMLEASFKKGIKKVLLLGHLGKIMKIAEGYFNTHHRHSKLNLGMIYELAKEAGARREILQKLKNASTAEESAQILKGYHLETILEKITFKAQEKMAERVGKGMEIGVALTSLTGEIIGMEENSREWVEN